MLNVRDATGSPGVKVDGEINLPEEPIEDETNLMVVGSTERGPAFIPKEITSKKELNDNFGLGESYVSHTAKRVLDETDRVNVMRVMNERGWEDTEPIVFYANVDQNDDLDSIPNKDSDNVDSDKILLSVLVVSNELKQKIDVTKTQLNKLGKTNTKPFLEAFEMEFYDSNGDLVDKFNLSFDESSNRYIGEVLRQNDNLNFLVNFEETQQKLVQVDSEYEVTTNWTQYSSGTKPITPVDYSNQSYSYAKTPWIISQTLSDGKRYPLFRFVARGAGNSENQRFKISINEIGDFREDSEYGFFTVQIRGFTDNDFTKDVLEEYKDVTLDPSHERYIKKVIGDRWKEVDENGRIIQRGRFENNSNYVRVEFDEKNVERAGKEALPYGFEGYFPPISSSYLEDNDVFFQTPNYRYEQEIGNISKYSEITRPGNAGESISDDIHLGFDFQKDENLVWLNSVANGFDRCFFINPSVERSSTEYNNKCKSLKSIFNDEGFHLEDAEDKIESYNTENIESRKFSVGLQGGFDGANPYRKKLVGKDINSSNTFGFDLSNTDNSDYRSYVKAVDILSEVTGGFDYNLLSTPGLDLNNHFSLVKYIEQVVRNRGDAFYIADVDIFNNSIAEIIDVTNRIDTSYVGVYYGWLDVKNLNDDFDILPSSSVVSSVYARNDRERDPWVPPSGYDEGLVENVGDVSKRLSKSQRDNLYENNINSIDVFSSGDVVLWGERTQYKENSSPLSQISTRRMLVTLKSRVREIAERNLFEQITPANLGEFENQVREILVDIRQGDAISNFDVSIQHNPESRRNKNLVDGSVSVSPINSVEYILINFVLEDNSFTFV